VTTRFTVTIRCDERSSPDCVGERVETHDALDGFELIAMRLLQEGWDWDIRPRRDGRTHDVCPTCGDLNEKALRPVPHERQPG
jgi:hypothetical protein